MLRFSCILSEGVTCNGTGPKWSEFFPLSIVLKTIRARSDVQSLTFNVLSIGSQYHSILSHGQNCQKCSVTLVSADVSKAENLP